MNLYSGTLNSMVFVGAAIFISAILACIVGFMTYMMYSGHQHLKSLLDILECLVVCFDCLVARIHLIDMLLTN